MNATFLFPRRFRMIGWALALPAIIYFSVGMYIDISLPFLNYGKTDSWFGHPQLTIFSLGQHNFSPEVSGILALVGLAFIGFSKERAEDERATRLRMESLYFAFIVNTVLDIAAIVLLYGEAFWQVMIYNFCSTLIIFIARFQWVLYKEKKRLKKEMV